MSVDTICCFSLGVSVKRREFIGLLGGAAAASPLAAWAQKSQQMRRAGMLLGLDEKDPETNSRVRAFRLGMRDLGWVEGRNVQIEYRFAGTNLESINKHVAELIRLGTRRNCRALQCSRDCSTTGDKHYSNRSGDGG